MIANHGEIRVTVFTGSTTPPTAGPAVTMKEPDAESPLDVPMTVTVYRPGSTFATVKVADTAGAMIKHVRPETRPPGEETTLQAGKMSMKPEPAIVTSVPGGPELGAIMIYRSA
jgi:hypothetical protein